MGEDSQENLKQVPIKHRKTANTTTMDDGGTNAGTERGRSKGPRTPRATSSDTARRKSRDKGEKEGRSTTKSPRGPGRPKGSKNKTRSTSKTRAPRTKGTATRPKEGTPRATGTSENPVDNGNEIDLIGEEGRAVKQEIIDIAKVQQVLTFPLLKPHEKGKGYSTSTAIELDDDEENKTQNTHTSRSGVTPKRKQMDMTKGLSKEPEGIAKRPTLTPGGRPHNGDNGRGNGHMGGRGRGRGRGGGGYGGGYGGGNHSPGPTKDSNEVEVLTPPHTQKTTNLGGNFNPTKEATREERKEGTDEVTERLSLMEVEETDEKETDTPVATGGPFQTHPAEEKEQSLQSNEATKEPKATAGRILNPYKTAHTPVTYASVTKSPQKKLKTHQKIKEAHDAFYEITFYADELSNNPSMIEVTAVLKAQIKSILLRAREVDLNAKINTWDDKLDLPTLVKSADIPDSPAHLQEYLVPPRRGKTMEKGRNSNWKIRITTHIPREEFVHHWSLSKRDFTRTKYVPLRSAPLQAQTYYAAGFFLNSSDGQLTETLEKKLGEELGHRIGIAYKPAALHKRAADEFWKKAKLARNQAPEYEKARAYFKNAPMVMQVYTETRMQAKSTAYKLNEKYGSTEQDGMYPRMPDGTRMRFVAAHVYVDMIGRATAATLFKQQMFFQKFEVTAQIPIRDPNQQFPSQGNKTMHELVMDLQDAESNNEPYFRNMKRKFHWNYKTQEWETQIHGGMYPRTAQILRRFKEYMTEQYGEEVGDAILDGTQEEIPLEAGSQGATTTGISIATDDRYLNGEAKFLIVGMENVQAHNGEATQTPEDVRRGEGDENTINIRSTTSGMTGHTGHTVQSTHGMDDDTRQNGRAIMEEMDIEKEEDTPYEDAQETITTSPSKAKGNEEADTGQDAEGWSTVPKGKGAKPRQATMIEKAASLATHLSGLMGGGEN